MNHYGQLVHDHNRRRRPRAYSQIPDPARFFEEAGARGSGRPRARRGRR